MVLSGGKEGRSRSRRIQGGGGIMDGIQTKVYCPACGKEIELLLERQEMPNERIIGFMRMLNMPVGDETAYRGETECSCGKAIKIIFTIEVYPPVEGAVIK
jgi:hypothetical protein